MRNFLKSIGLIKVESINPYGYNSSTYNLTKESSKIKAHKEFLKSTLEEENNRLLAIEGKTNQLVSQTSIVFSLLSLIIPILIDKLGDAHIGIKILLLFLVLGAFAFYFLAIFNALKNFNIKNFNYFVAAPGNVLDFMNKSEEEFEAELVRDYLDSINNNMAVNNIKATNLLHSNNAFKIGNILTIILVVAITLVVLFNKKNPESLEKQHPHKVKVDSNGINKIFIHDTVFVKRIDTIVKVDTIFLKK